jgi:periplasmic protein CpxP/Spy
MRKNLKTILTTAALAALTAGSAFYGYAADSKSSPPMGGMMGGMMQGGQGDMSGMMNMMQQMNQMMDSCNAMMKDMDQHHGSATPKGEQKPAPTK